MNNPKKAEMVFKTILKTKEPRNNFSKKMTPNSSIKKIQRGLRSIPKAPLLRYTDRVHAIGWLIKFIAKIHRREIFDLKSLPNAKRESDSMIIVKNKALN
jgi:hypothetical protein